jgi:ParB family transcriptional regulator, chromosome partitioning protein
MRSALGKGLDALISDDTVASVAAVPTAGAPAVPSTLPIDCIHSNPKQPRRDFSEQALSELTESIKQKGVLQPIVVSSSEGGQYEIIAGERRWRAAQRAGLKDIPVVIRSGTEAERFELALIENLQREDLNPIDLGMGYRRLQDEFQMTQEAIAQVVGKDRAVVANTLRLLTLPGEIQKAIREGKISSGHARALASVEDQTVLQALYKRILKEELTVRAVEQAVRDHKQAPSKREHLRAAGYESRPPETKALEEDLQHTLTRKVEIHTAGSASQKGWIKLEFYSLDEFDALIAHLKR